MIPETETITIMPKKSLDASTLSIDSLPVDDVTTWSDDIYGSALRRENMKRNASSRDSALGVENSAYKGDSL